jgi:hypothetical protein
MSQLYRPKTIQRFTFASGATVATNTIDLQGISAVGFIFPSEFNGDTITVKTALADDTGISFTAPTGRYTPTSDQALALAPMASMTMTTSAATSAAAEVIVLLMG